MFSDEEIKELPDGSYMRPGDEIISIREVCLADKFDRKDLGLHLLPSSSRNDICAHDSHLSLRLDMLFCGCFLKQRHACLGLARTGKDTYLRMLDSRSLFRDSFFAEGLEGQAKFAWTEEDGNIAALVSEPGFGTTGQTTFGRQIDAALKSEMKEADTSSSVVHPTNRSISSKNLGDLVSSTSSGNPSLGRSKPKGSTGTCKVDKADPRSRFHFVKYVKRHGRTVKLWECGICNREFQHQYTLMRHLPTHTDERNFHCDVCGKSFRQLSTLSQHRAIHSAERPYACEVCSKTFNRVSTLISHRKTHSDEKPYKCHICPKGFHQKGNLRNHLFTHTNERPYRCNVCYKGFNQQSNLVCHKNKAHPENKEEAAPPRAPRPPAETKPEGKRPQKDYCEVSSSVGPYLSNEGSTSWQNRPFESAEWGLTSGVIVDPIKTYQMEVAIATKQTPFALLKPDNASPVLVKVVDTSLPGGKQMLVPATAEDLRNGGKIVVKDENDDIESQEIDVESSGDILQSDGAVQIRVPVVATVVPRITGGRLHLSVEEPHCAYHTTLSADVGEIKIEPCSEDNPDVPRSLSETNPGPSTQREPRYIELNTSYNKTGGLSGSGISSTCSMPSPALSPPLDLIAMDLFEPMECMPLGPQITAVDNIDHPPPSDDSDIFIGDFEESIQLSDSD